MEAILASVGILGLFFVIMVTAFVMAKRYIKVGPNEVLVISGRRRSVVDVSTGAKAPRNYRIVKGGGTFILPVLERVDRLSLELMTIEVVTPKVYTGAGVPVTVDGVAQIKIRGDEVSIGTAAEQLLSKTTVEIKDVALQTLEGHLRAILGTLTVEELYQDRDAFAQRVQEMAAGDLANMGLGIISFTIRDIRDDEGYLDALGKARTAEVKRDAAIGEANAQRDARIQAAKALQAAREAEFAAETRVAEAEKSFSVQKAAYDQETNTERAKAELAFSLEENRQNQAVQAEAVQIEVIQKQKQIEVQTEEVRRRELELEAQVRKPAEAKQYEIETLARARRFQLETEAEGQAGAAKSMGGGEAEAARLRGMAAAEIDRARGLATAAVIEAQGRAEAEAKRAKAEAWAHYTQAAIVDQMLQQLPELARAIAQPLASVDRIVVIGGQDGEGVGLSKLTGDVSIALSQLPPLVEALTGVDMIASLAGLQKVKSTEASSDEAGNQAEAAGKSPASATADTASKPPATAQPGPGSDDT